MAIRIDADACPDIFVIEQLTKQFQKELFLYRDQSHQIESAYGKCILCDTGFQSVDMKLLEDTLKGDLVITQDYGLAALALAKRAYVLHPKGFYYTEDKINILLMERYLNGRVNKHRKGPKKRTKQDTEKLYQCILLYLRKTK